MELPVRIFDEANQVSGEILFDTTDMSIGGAFLRSSVLFEVGEELTVEFVLSPSETVRARARVVRIASGEPPGMGIKFTALAEAERETIRGLLCQ